MKKLFAILFACTLSCGIFSSCSYQIASQMSTSLIDVRTYSQQGFFILPSSAPGSNYSPIGEISVVVTHGKTVDAYSGTTTKYNRVDMDSAVKKMVDDAKALGADCIVNFKSDERVGYIILTGFAVKIQ